MSLLYCERKFFGRLVNNNVMRFGEGTIRNSRAVLQNRLRPSFERLPTAKLIICEK